VSNLALFKKGAAIAALATAGVVAMAGTASASPHRMGGDNNTHQSGLIPVYALNNVNVSPNLGCVLNQPLRDMNLNNIVSLIPIDVDLHEILRHTVLNVLSNGNVSTEIEDESCTSNQGSSQAGNNSHGSVGAGDSSNVHGDGNGAGAHNQSGNGAGGLLGTTGLLGAALGLGKG
jgi:hypothetical protein